MNSCLALYSEFRDITFMFQLSFLEEIRKGKEHDKSSTK